MRIRRSRIFFGILLCFLLSAIVTACVGSSPKVTFYRLTDLPQDPPAGKLADRMGVAVAPIALPDELKRPHILVREAGSRVTISEYHRWAGTLEQEIAQVMSSHLRNLLSTDRIGPGLVDQPFPITHRLQIHFSQLDGKLDGDVILDATWSIRQAGRDEPDIIQRTRIRKSLSTSSYEGLVETEGMVLQELSRRIAEKLLLLKPDNT